MTPAGPIEPPSTGVEFPDPTDLPEPHIAAVGGDFRPGTLLAAYRSGIFPWPHSPRFVPWCSPNPRAIFPLPARGEGPPHWSRSLRRTLRQHPYRISVDEAFGDVVVACGDERPKERWIIPAYARGFAELHALGWTHSVEVWEKNGAGEALVGGIYGLAIGRFFAGESMFHRRTDCSKIAFATLVERLVAGGFTLFDVQVMNDHLRSLGCIELPRDAYLDRLEDAASAPAATLTLR